MNDIYKMYVGAMSWHLSVTADDSWWTRNYTMFLNELQGSQWAKYIYQQKVKLNTEDYIVT